MFKDNIGMTEELHVELVECSSQTIEDQVREILARLDPEKAKQIIEAFRVELENK
jgi:Zn ribbon nucleic-acid-binding protein